MRTANQYLRRRPRELRLAGLGRLGWWALAVALAGAGCAHSRNKDRIGLIPPPAPAFLNGPMAVLLTNASGFSCHVVMSVGSPANPGERVAGELLGRGTQLLFVPDANSLAGKRFAKRGFSFIWDAAGQRGYLLSEALQGYAPISSPVQATNVVVRASRPAPERAGGHPCQQTEVEVASNNGTRALFRVWRAADLKGFPICIVTAAPGRPLAVNASKLRLEAPSSRLFLPPDGFTRYDSAETMMAEMAMRQENLRRKPTEEPLEFQRVPRLEAR
ncbi:MAG: hypothetical protein ABSF95_08765 [Verrucomicrobiota bacterium]|jgi:hypothetical protein